MREIITIISITVNHSFEPLEYLYKYCAQKNTHFDK